MTHYRINIIIHNVSHKNVKQSPFSIADENLKLFWNSTCTQMLKLRAETLKGCYWRADILSTEHKFSLYLKIKLFHLQIYFRKSTTRASIKIYSVSTSYKIICYLLSISLFYLSLIYRPDQERTFSYSVACPPIGACPPVYS